MKDMMKRKDKMLSENEKDAKMSVIKAMRDEAAQQMGGKLEGLKKVTVASPDEAGLKAGLDKAKELISKKEQPENSEPCEECQGEGCPMCDMGENESSEDMTEYEGMSEQELNAKLEKLMALKKKMEQKAE